MCAMTRRQFLRDLAFLGLGSLGTGALLSAAGCRNPLLGAAPLDLSSPYVREAMYYVGLQSALDCQACHTVAEPSRVLSCHVPHAGDYVRCELCPKGCLLADGQRGHCRVRENYRGKLYTLVYGNPCAVHIDPIEKKPFYHVLPGSASFSLATAGCNLRCLYCQNWTISQSLPEEVESSHLMPEQVVETAYQNRCASIAFTYSEPTVFYEYMLDTARLARHRGIKSVVVSAGYINPGPLRTLCAAVDAIKIDFKGFSESFYERVCQATLSPVLETMKVIRESGAHLEIVNLVVPTLNDKAEELRDLCQWIADRLGPDVPVHFTRFQPLYKLQHLPMTPLTTLEAAYTIARDAGIRYVYVGNVPGHKGNNTYCPRCGQLLIERVGFTVTGNQVRQGKCAFCGYPIVGIWQ